MQVNTPGDYLFLSSVYSSLDGVQRGFYAQGWSVEGGTKSAVGQSGRYSRGGQGVRQFGNTSGFVGAGLSALSTVEMVSLALGNGGTNLADQINLQAVSISSLLTSEVVIAPQALAVTEGGGSESYIIQLGQAPASGAVEVTATADSQSEVSPDGITFGPSVALSFTAGGIPQTVFARALDDSDVESSHSATITHTVTATDDAANFPTSLELDPVALVVSDNDVIPVTAVDDTSNTNASEDAVADQGILAPQANLLTNDTNGINNEVIAFDPLSSMGAQVTVQPDGTFTYDPTEAGMLQALPEGSSAVDTFDYTVQDADGNTSTGTVSLTVDGPTIWSRPRAKTWWTGPSKMEPLATPGVWWPTMALSGPGRL